jgi:hypothetical protein
MAGDVHPSRPVPDDPRFDRRCADSHSPSSRADVLRDEDRQVRTMFVLYSLFIVGGVVFFVSVGLTQQ